MKRYRILPPRADGDARLMLQNGTGSTSDFEVIDMLINLLVEAEEDATFVQPNGRELSPETAKQLRKEIGHDLRLV